MGTTKKQQPLSELLFYPEPKDVMANPPPGSDTLMYSDLSHTRCHCVSKSYAIGSAFSHPVPSALHGTDHNALFEVLLEERIYTQNRQSGNNDDGVFYLIR